MAVRLSKDHLQQVKAVLQQRIGEAREELKAARTRIETPWEASFYGSHSEAGSETYDREMAGADQTRASKFLEKAQEALIRIEKWPDKFGICRGCGKLIPVERLLAVPITEHCAECKNGEVRPKKTKK